jgi:hypothetical protein
VVRGPARPSHLSDRPPDRIGHDVRHRARRAQHRGLRRLTAIVGRDRLRHRHLLLLADHARGDERAVPEGGALALAIVGGIGTLSAAIFTWILGGMYDRLGPRLALRYMAVLPLILIVVFTLWWLYDRRRGGYRVVKL